MDNIEDKEQEFEYYVSLINAFTIYYKKRQHINDNANMLEGMDYTDPSSTNKITEEFYEHIRKYKEYLRDDTTNANKDDKDINNKKETVVYELTINKKVTKVSKFIFPLIMYLVDENILIDSDRYAEWEIKQL